MFDIAAHTGQSIAWLESEDGQERLKAYPVTIIDNYGYLLELGFNVSQESPGLWSLLQPASDLRFISPHEALALVVADWTARLVRSFDSVAVEHRKKGTTVLVATEESAPNAINDCVGLGGTQVEALRHAIHYAGVIDPSAPLLQRAGDGEKGTDDGRRS